MPLSLMANTAGGTFGSRCSLTARSVSSVRRFRLLIPSSRASALSARAWEMNAFIRSTDAAWARSGLAPRAPSAAARPDASSILASSMNPRSAPA